MKASLVSATSLMALLAFEVGLEATLDVPRAHAASFTASPASLSFGYVLLNVTGGTTATLTESAVNTTKSQNVITFGAIATSPFSGSQSTVTLSNTTGSSVTAKNVYKFSPTVTGASSNSITIIGSAGATTVTVSMSGTAVAPVQATTVSAFGAVRIGTTATIAAITVSNKGDGDLALGGSTLSAAQLQGSLGAPSSSVFSGSTHTFSLNDTHYSGTGTATTSAAYTYTYAPTAHTTADSATVVAAFTNGSSAGTNAAQTVSLTLSGSGVGPEYESKINGTTYTNSTAIGHGTLAAGTISMGAYKTGATSSLTLTLSNISTDAGSASLTDLTLESFSLSGADASDFSVVGFTTNTTVAEAGSVTVTLDFSGPTIGNYTADLNFSTDQGAALGGAGAVFSYALSAAVPEPATIVTLGAGLVGLAFTRRRRRRSTDTPKGQPA
jgi:PEP-CTERM motif